MVTLKGRATRPVHFHLKMLMTLEKSSVQTFDPGLLSNGLHLESPASLPKSLELRPMTTQVDASTPFFVWASLMFVSVSIKPIKPASPARGPTTG
jgi:hypothetical protein